MSRSAPSAVHARRPGHTLDELEQLMNEINADAVAISCASGYRSSVAASLLAHHGHAQIANVIGGTSVAKSGLPLSSP